MKKLISILLFASLLISCLAAFGVSAEDAPTFIGDVSEDGSLNLKDLLLLRKVVAGAEELKVITYADVNFDGSINVKDILVLRKMIAGAETVDQKTVSISVSLEDFALQNGLVCAGKSEVPEAAYTVLKDYVESKNGLSEDRIAAGADPGTVILRTYSEYESFKEGLPVAEFTCGNETVICSFVLPELSASFFGDNLLIVSVNRKAWASDSTYIINSGGLIYITNFVEWMPGEEVEPPAEKSISCIGINKYEYRDCDGVVPREYNEIYKKEEMPEFTRTGETYSAAFIPDANLFGNYLLSYFGAQGGVIDSYEEYVSFCDGMPLFWTYGTGMVTEGDFIYSYKYYFALPDIDRSFFDDNVLAIGCVGSPCCNYEFTADGVSSDGETLTIDLTLNNEGLGLDAIEVYAVLVAVDRDYAAGATDAIFVPTCEYGPEPAWW